jgi:adenine-specific DNA-methyltransferase
MNNDKMKFETPNLTAENVAKIASLFPGVVAEGKVNFDLLRTMLGDEIFTDEAYEFTWVGKRDAIAEAGRPIRKTLRPCPGESKNWDNTENLYIEGDNLEVLKLLQESYLGKVKMIYIDPPYNTGNDLIYSDSFTINRDQYDGELGIFDEEGDRLFTNTESNGRFHSDWCSMIYPRLMLARSLLSDNGAIFISIDDNEYENLKKICDEVFGEHNRLETFHIQVRYGNKSLNERDDFQKLIEYNLIYAKNKKQFVPRKEKTDYDLTKFNLKICENKEPDKHIIVRGREVDVFLKGSYSINVVSDEETAKMDYYKETWVTGSIYSGTGHGLVYQQVVEPRSNEDGYEVLYKIYGLGEDGLGYRYMTGPKQASYKFGKMYNKVPLNKIEGLKEGTYKKSKPILNFYDYSPDFGNIRHEGGIAFNGGKKPVKMLKYFLGIIDGNDYICLDFFSGSASTAHAVMQLNAEDGGKRKFIMVQLPEVCAEGTEAAKAGYTTICEIGKERIRRAGEKIKEEVKAANVQLKLGEEPKQVPDIGFRVLKVDDSNMNDVYYAAGDYTQDLLAMTESNIKADRSDLDLLFGCLLDWGLPLSMPHTHELIDGFTVHTYNSGDLVACFEENVSEKAIREIAARKPLRAVFRDDSFTSSPEKINVFEIFKLLAPNTTVRVL